MTTEGLENFGYGDVFISTINGSVFILSDNVYSLRGAVMEYLREELGAEVYSANCYSVDVKAEGENYVLQEQNRVVCYDMDIRTTDVKFLGTDSYPMGYVPRAETIFLVSISAHQTITCYVPYSTYGAEHPMWYSGYDSSSNTNALYNNTGKPAQVCFNANGNAEELQLMKEAFLDTMINHQYGLKKNSLGSIFIFGNQDNQDYCQCTACLADKEKYGVYNATALKFCNSVAEMLKAWMETDEGKPYKRDFEIMFLAYDTDIGAPATYNNDTKKWEPIDQTVVCNENVSVFFAPAGLDPKRSIYDAANDETRYAFEGWKACSDEVSLYLYQSNWRDVFSYYDSLSCMQELYQFFATGNIKFIHNSGFGNPALTRFETLTSYISSTLAKDVNADVTEATQNFFDAYFGVASQPMKQYFDSYMAWTKHLRDDDVYKTIGVDDFKGPSYLSEILINEVANGYVDYTKLAEWAGYIDEALLAIEPLKASDEEMYNFLYQRIIAERLAVYFPAAYHKKNLGSLSYTTLRETFMADCELLGISKGGWLWPDLENDLFSDWKNGSSGGGSWWEDLWPW